MAKYFSTSGRLRLAVEPLKCRVSSLGVRSFVQPIRDAKEIERCGGRKMLQTRFGMPNRPVCLVGGRRSIDVPAPAVLRCRRLFPRS
jgi:hypothetical protein